MDKLSGRLRAVRDRSFGGSNVRFADAIDVTEGSVRGWIRGDHRPGAEVIDAVCRVSGVSPQWLLTGKGSRDQTLAALPSPELRLVEAKASWFRGFRERIDAYYPVPLVAGRVAAGSPAEVSEDEVDDWIPTIYHRDWCPHPEQTVCVRVRGDSMAPTIPDGGLVAIDLAQRQPARLIRQVVALRREGGVTIKRLFRTDDGEWVARPDNLDSNEIYVFAPDELNDAILGKVVWWWGRQ
ncbi:MAG: helix-turn-helix domain-containing protein [Deltaproteobacteria bacterium]|nr:helix-turn-helix domain-containing protein [Deltaproteobacteria bacterium]